jgi:hypothetical protein
VGWDCFDGAGYSGAAGVGAARAVMKQGNSQPHPQSFYPRSPSLLVLTLFGAVVAILILDTYELFNSEDVDVNSANTATLTHPMLIALIWIALLLFTPVILLGIALLWLLEQGWRGLKRCGTEMQNPPG